MSQTQQSSIAQPLDVRERSVDDTEFMQTALDGRQRTINTSLPGIIVSYDPATLTARVRPAIQAVQLDKDGKRQPVTLTELPDVPVHFPGGGGAILTFPVKPGDDCMLVFQQRSLDYWHQLGGVQKQQDARMHDINDAICLVGVRSLPAVPGAVSGTTTQLRTDDGSVLLELDQGGTIRLVAPSTVIVNTPLVRVSGDVIAGTISLRNHRHRDTQPGGGMSGVPNP